MSAKYDSEKKKLIDKYKKTDEEEDRINQAGEGSSNDEGDNEEDSAESEDDLEGSDNDEESEQDDDEDEQDSESDEESEESEAEESDGDEESDGENQEDENSDDDKEDQEDTEDKESQDDSDEQPEDEENSDEESDEDKKDSEDKDKSKDDDSNKGPNSEDRKKLGPDVRKNKLNLDDYKKPPNVLEKGANVIKRKTNSARDNVAMRLGQIKSAITGALSAVKGVVMGIVKLLVNPLFWIILGAILAITIIVALIATSMAVLGGNDYNKLCGHNGVSSISVDEGWDDLERQSAIAAWLMSTPFEATGGQPMSREQAVAVIGNLKLESFMANPKAIGGIDDWNVEMWEVCDNDCVKNSTMGSNPVGLVQHLGGRRDHLVSMAEAAGVQWYDLNIQLEHLKAELDGNGNPDDPVYEMNQIKLGFANPGKTVEEYTWLWQKDFERAGESKNSSEMALRQKYAKEFDEEFSGTGAVIGSGAMANCTGGMLDTSSITAMAESIAWTREEKSAKKGYGSCGASPGCGKSFSKPEYVELKEKVESETGTDGGNIKGLLASCDALVATLIRGSGIDENIPYHDTSTQISYLNDPKNGWEKANCQNKQPGDVFGETGHIMIYVGIIDGKETMVSASLGARSAHMANISCQGELYRGDDKTVPGWRKVK